MHQGSALSSLLFLIVMDALSREFRVAVPWELLYADDLVVIAETADDPGCDWFYLSGQNPENRKMVVCV